MQPVRAPLTDMDQITLENAVLSRDCTYLAILYSGRLYRRGYNNDLVTSIWIIEDSLDFHDLRRRRPWARRLHCFRTQALDFSGSCLALTAGWDGLFYCPSGQIHPEFGIQKQLPLAAVNKEYGRDKGRVYALAGDGQTFIKLDRVKGLVEKILWLEDTVTKTWQFPIPASYAQQEEVYLRAISRTAQFMVYEARNKLNDKLYVEYYLFHCQGNLEPLRVQNVRSFTKVIFYFTQDEQYLLGIYSVEHRKE